MRTLPTDPVMRKHRVSGTGPAVFTSLQDHSCHVASENASSCFAFPRQEEQHPRNKAQRSAAPTRSHVGPQGTTALVGVVAVAPAKLTTSSSLPG